MKNSKMLRGQIMVIVLLFLAVLTIIAVGVTLNTSRDTKEQVADKQYQQYYSVGERIIVDLINFIGKDSLTPLSKDSINPININSLDYLCSEESSAVNCTIKEIPNTYFNESGTAEVLTSVIKIEDLTEIDEATTGSLFIKKDQDLLFDFAETGHWDTLTFSWEDPESNEVIYTTSWNFSYDYYSEGSNVYKTDKLVWDKSNGNIYSQESTILNSPDACFSISFSQEPNTNPKMTVINGECNGASELNPLFFRIKPVSKDNETVKLTEISFEGGNSPAIARKITSTTTTSNSGNSDSPSAVLETIYFLGKTPLSLFDYVLRTEDSIIKQ